MGFTKLDENILQSSIMAEDDSVFKVWIALLAACKENGIANISPMFLSSICRKDISIISQAIEKLSLPDDYSRSINDSGKRIERVDGGFRIINYQKYRDFTYSHTANAERQRRFRAKKALHGVTCNDSNDSNGDISASGINKESTIQEGINKGSVKKGVKDIQYSPEFLAFWKTYPRKTAKPRAYISWVKKNCDIKIDIILAALAWQGKEDQWTRDRGKYIPHPTTWLNNDCWEDEPVSIPQKWTGDPERNPNRKFFG